jgi:hypothetical protein
VPITLAGEDYDVIEVNPPTVPAAAAGSDGDEPLARPELDAPHESVRPTAGK